MLVPRSYTLGLQKHSRANIELFRRIFLLGGKLEFLWHEGRPGAAAYEYERSYRAVRSRVPIYDRVPVAAQLHCERKKIEQRADMKLFVQG